MLSKSCGLMMDWAEAGVAAAAVIRPALPFRKSRRFIAPSVINKVAGKYYL
jgi:hypothetical protein